MKVYVLTQDEDSEGGSPHGVYTDIALAKADAEEQTPKQYRPLTWRESGWSTDNDRSVSTECDAGMFWAIESFELRGPI